MGSLACRAGENKRLLQNATYGLAALKAILDAMEGSGFATGTDSLKILSDVLDAIEGSGFSTTTDSLKVLSDMLDTIRTELTFQHQAAAQLTQTNPTQNTWYTILDTTPNVRLYSLVVRVDTTNETLDVRFTIDGLTISQTVDVTAATWYRVRMNIDAPTYLEIATSYLLAHGYSFLEARSLKIEVRKTTAAGTGTMYGRASYAKR